MPFSALVKNTSVLLLLVRGLAIYPVQGEWEPPTPLVQVQPRLESQKVNGKSTLPLCNLRRTTALTHPQARLGPHKPSDVQRLRRLAVTAYYVIRVLYVNIKANLTHP